MKRSLVCILTCLIILIVFKSISFSGFRFGLSDAISNAAKNLDKKFVEKMAIKPPTNLYTVAVTHTQINLTWNDNSNNETGFKIERKTGTGGTYLQIATVNSDVTSYNDTGLSQGNTYYYRVCAYNVAGNSGYSNESTPNGTIFVLSWGSSGSGAGHFNSPYGITIDTSNNVYVTDYRRVQKFDSSGTYITQWGSYGNGTGQFAYYPYGIAVDSLCNVYVTDTDNNRIEKFSSNGTFITQWGSNGTNSGQFRYPSAIAIDGRGDVYVADMSNDRMQKFSSNGTYITQWTNSSSYGIAINGSEHVYVTEMANNQIHVFSSTVPYIPQWGSSGTGNGQFNHPHGIALDGSGNVFVADRDNNRIQKFSSTGEYIAQWGSLGSNYGQFNRPCGIAVDSQGYVYVVDSNNNRIQKFSSIGSASNINTGSVPTPPSNLGAVVLSSSTISLSWQDNANNEMGFKIERKTGIGGTYAQITTVGSNVINYIDTGLITNTTYYYQVKAYNLTGDSGYSNETSAVIANFIVYYQPTKIINSPNPASIFANNSDTSVVTSIITDDNGNIIPVTSALTFTISGPGTWLDGTTNYKQINVINGIATTLVKSTSTAGNITIKTQGSVQWNCLQFKAFVSGTGNSFWYRDISHPSYIVVSGDVLEYDIYFPASSTNKTGGVDIEFSDGSNLRDSGAVDQNGVSVHPSTNLSSRAVDQWYHRVIPFPQASYKSITAVEFVQEGDSGTNEFYVRNIWIKNGSIYKLVVYNAESSFTYPADTFGPGNSGYNLVDEGVIALTTQLTDGTTTVISHAPPPSLALKWGNGGSGDGQFNNPNEIVVDSSGNVYVVDSGNDRIQKFSSTGTYITQWGNHGSGDGQFNFPGGVAVDNIGNVYIVDVSNNRIQKFSSTGTFITKWGSQGSSDGQFNSPSGVAVDSLGNVYIADSTGYRIQKFNSTGTFVTKWGSEGTNDGQFNHPNRIALDGSGNVYVNDTGNNRIQKFSSTGTFVTKWGISGYGDGQFYSPWGITVDSSENVYTADTWNHRIQKFSSTGTYITQWGNTGSGDGQFLYPYGVAVDSSGNVYVVDYGNGRVQKFSP
jgi:DNA-binding beta-propeller fold protein YncE